MPKGEALSRSEQEADECLHCAIIDMVDDRIAAGGANAADLTRLIVESLVDIILRVPEEEQAQLIAHTRARSCHREFRNSDMATDSFESVGKEVSPSYLQ